MNKRKWTCNPLIGAEIVGRDYLLSLTTRESINKVNSVGYSLQRMNELTGGVEDSFQNIKAIHGEYGQGVNSQVISFAKNLFKQDPAFDKGLFELEKLIIQAKETVDEFSNLIDNIENITMGDLTSVGLRIYIDNVNGVMPDFLRKEMYDRLDEVPMFSEIADNLGSVFKDFIIDDKATNIIDNIIGDILCETGLSTLLRNDSWLRLAPDYAMNLHDNLRKFQRLSSLVMPKCSYSKIYNIMDEPLAHIYSLARDAYFFFDVLDNRKAIISNFIYKYRRMAMLLNTFFPTCAEVAETNYPRINKGVAENNLGDPIQDVQNITPVTQVLGLS